MSLSGKSTTDLGRRRYDSEILEPLVGLSPVNIHDLIALRESSAEALLHFQRSSDGEIEIVDEILFTEDGSIRLRLYIPRSGYTGGLLWVHGGAFVLGSPEVDDDLCRHLALTHRLIIVSPDYRLAPEHPHPAAELDCYAAFTFLRNLVSEISEEATIVVAGASAGGALALETALSAISFDFKVERLMLAYPVVDSSLTSESMKKYESAPIFDGAHAQVMWDRYLGERDGNAWSNPLKNPNLQKLPLTLVITTENDPLRDEGLELVRSLLSAGVSVQALHIAGSYHAFDRFAPDSQLAKDFLFTFDHFLKRPLLIESNL
jgi:acetyl esterase/lipase